MNHSIYRISKELSEIQKNPDLSLAVACRDSDVRNVMALIMGPHETPYEFGFFEFSIQFGDMYPQAPPTVRCVTTNRGTCRFNPNIYAEGRVCLSILGTWRGEAGEQWSSAQGLESILLSIQSLMSSNPYTNEPGYEETKTPEAEEDSKKYAQKIQHETLRISVIQRLEGYLRLAPAGVSVPREPDPSDDSSSDEAVPKVFEPFKDLCKRRFLWYYDSYLATIKKGKREVGEKQAFEKAAFESGSNGMAGAFVYQKLEERLQKIKDALDQETAQWAIDGLTHKARESTVSVNLQYQFDHISESAKTTNASYSLELENGNPFVWLLSYFGETFDGAVINIRISFSPNFPQEQPRVKVENNIFHQRVSSHGTLCYTPNSMKVEDVKSHVDAIVGTLEETSPSYDPRKIVNPEATKLYWGKEPDSRKKYNRQLRRSIDDGAQ